MTFFHQYNQRSLHFLNATQFLGALNDNIFKLLIVYFLISLEGETQATTILSIVGAIFVIPFLLFSSAAGILADKVSKRNVIVSMKILELIIMLVSLLGVVSKSPTLLYGTLFLMASQSAIFGPSKYGIIPEIVTPDQVAQANGVLTSFTFLAIIIGTFLASFVTDVSNKHFVFAFSVCIGVALIGFLTSFGINKTDVKKSTKKFNPLFIVEIYKTLTLCYKRKYLLVSVIGSAFFLFLGGFVQLNTIPFAIQSLNLSDIGGGYLFLTTAVGIAIGSLVVGKLVKDHIGLNLSCLSGYVMSILLLLLGFFPHNLGLVIALLVLLGFFGGIFIVPFDSFIQMRSPDARRGQIIAASNFLSFLGVLLASFALFLIGNVFSFSSASGFIIMGLICFGFTFVLSGRIADVFIPFFTEKLIVPFFSIKAPNLPPKNSLIIYEKTSKLNIIMLFSALPDLKIIIYGKLNWKTLFLRIFFSTIFFIKRTDTNLSELIAKANDLKEKEGFVCVYITESINEKVLQHTLTEQKTEENLFSDFIYLKTELHRIPMTLLKIAYKKKLFAIVFSKQNPRTESLH